MLCGSTLFRCSEAKNVLQECFSSAGIASGYWTKENDSFKWKFPPGCQIAGTEQDIANHVQDARNPRKNLSILLLGDSVDRYWLEAICNAGGSQPVESKGCHISHRPRSKVDTRAKIDKFPKTCLKKCILPWLDISAVHLLGSALDGPYHSDYEGNYKTRVDSAMQEEGFPVAVDLVIASSLFWDVSRLMTKNFHLVETGMVLPVNVMKEYEHNLTTMLQYFQSVIPLKNRHNLVFHTTGEPRADCKNENADIEVFGKISYFAQLNAIARSVVKKQAWLLFDFAHQLSGLPKHLTMRDSSHPSDWFFVQNLPALYSLLLDPQRTV